MSRRDVIVGRVGLVHLRFGLAGAITKRFSLKLKKGELYDRDEMLRQLVKMQFSRNDYDLDRGTFRARGDVIEIHPVDRDEIVRVELFGDDVQKIVVLDPLTARSSKSAANWMVFPATHYVASRDRIEKALIAIEEELDERLVWYRKKDRVLEAQRIEQRTRYDLEMIREIGYCQGIENYSRHFDGARRGSLRIRCSTGSLRISCSSSTNRIRRFPQVRAMYAGRPVAQGEPSSTTGSDCRRLRQPAADFPRV